VGYGLPSHKDEASAATFDAPPTFRSVATMGPGGGSHFGGPSFVGSESSFGNFNPDLLPSHPYSSGGSSPYGCSPNISPTLEIAKEIRIETASFEKSSKEPDGSCIKHLSEFELPSINQNNVVFKQTTNAASVISDVTRALQSAFDSARNEHVESFSMSYSAESCMLEGKVKLGKLTINDVVVDCGSGEECEFQVSFHREMAGAKKQGVLAEVNRWAGCSFAFREVVNAVRKV